jgi:hypothetical protein
MNVASAIMIVNKWQLHVNRSQMGEQMVTRRKSIISLLFISIISMGVCVLAVSLIAQDSKAKSELAKIEAYIQGFVEQNGFYQRSSPNGDFLSQRDHIVFDGCNVTMHLEMVIAEGPLYKKESGALRATFNLKELSPKVVTRTHLYGDDGGEGDEGMLPDNRQWIFFKTADGSESITFWDKKTPASISSAYAFPGGSNHEENQKLADALSRAITICSQKQ